MDCTERRETNPGVELILLFILYACLWVFPTLLAVDIFLVSERDSTDWLLGSWPSLSMVSPGTSICRVCKNNFISLEKKLQEFRAKAHSSHSPKQSEQSSAVYTNSLH